MIYNFGPRLVQFFPFFEQERKIFCSELKEKRPKEEKSWRRNIQHSGTQHNDTRHNDTQHNDSQHNNTWHNDTQHNGSQHNNT